VVSSLLFAAGVAASSRSLDPEGNSTGVNDRDSIVLEEVVVTAQKRGSQNLQDIAMSPAVISSELIDLKQLVGMSVLGRSTA